MSSSDSGERTFLQKVGGRKQFNGLIASVLLTLMAFPLDADFSTYSLALLGALGLTGSLMAWEDVKKASKS